MTAPESAPKPGTPYSPVNMAMAETLEQLRDEAGLSQPELCRRAGVSRSGYARWRSGKRSISVDYLMVLADALGMTPAAILRRAQRDHREAFGLPPVDDEKWRFTTLEASELQPVPPGTSH